MKSSTNLLVGILSLAAGALRSEPPPVRLANHAAYAPVQERNEIGELRKIAVHGGHQGPKEIGCSAAFLGWFTDPMLNGGGALTDFGCHGANPITWLMTGQRIETTPRRSQ